MFDSDRRLRMGDMYSPRTRFHSEARTNEESTRNATAVAFDRADPWASTAFDMTVLTVV